MRINFILSLCLVFSFKIFASDQLKLELAIGHAKLLASDKILIDTIRKENLNKNKTQISNEDWAKLSVTNQVVQNLIHNEVIDKMKKRAESYVSELFISSSDGNKIGFFQKTTNFNHKGKAKHDLPMKGEVFIGKMERDESSGVHQIQIGVPVLDNKTPIGSLVIGVSVVKYEKIINKK